MNKEDAYRFLNEVSDSIQRYGLSTVDTWNRVSDLARRLGWNVSFISTPNHVQSVFWQEDDEDDQRLHIITRRSGNYDLARLAQVRALMRQVEAGFVLPDEGRKRLHEIRVAPAAYGPLLNALAYMMCGAGFAVILRASWLDVMFGGLISLVSFGVALWADRSRGVATLMELLAAMISAVLASILAIALPVSNPMAVTVCAVIYFVPGFGLTIAPNELILGNALSGLIWLTNASVTSLKLLGGAVMGFAIVQEYWQIAQPEPAAGVGVLWSWIFVPLLVIGLAILFRVPKRELGWVLLGAWAVWGGMQAGNAFGSWQGSFLGAAALVLFANLCYRIFRVSVAAIVLPGIMVLVPGVATLRALYAAQTQGPAAGFQSATQIVVLIAAILGGVLVGSAILSSFRTPRRGPNR